MLHTRIRYLCVHHSLHASIDSTTNVSNLTMSNSLDTFPVETDAMDADFLEVSGRARADPGFRILMSAPPPLE